MYGTDVFDNDLRLSEEQRAEALADGPTSLFMTGLELGGMFAAEPTSDPRLTNGRDAEDEGAAVRLPIPTQNSSLASEKGADILPNILLTSVSLISG